jgi:MoxR-like ATPase
MQEERVTIEGNTFDLPVPFMVIATQNPIEMEGTFSLPEAQRDRFMVKTSIGYPGKRGELELIDRRSDRTTMMPEVEAVVDPEDVKRLRQVSERVTMADAVREYLVDVARATREDDRVEVGVSPRGIQRFYEVARAHAVVNGRDYVAPDDVKGIAPAVVTHRLVLHSEAEIRDVDPAEVVADVLNGIEVPAASGR